MQLLGALNILLVGLWVGMYLFTTFVVSPAFVALFPDGAERSAHRRTLGRYYARANGPLSAAVLLVALAQGWMLGWTWWLGLELLALLLIAALVAGHIRRAETQLPPAWLTQATLLLSLSLCVLAVGAARIGGTP